MNKPNILLSKKQLLAASSALDDTRFKNLILACVDYDTTGTLPDFEDDYLLKGFFILFRFDLDDARAHYEKNVSVRRAAAYARWEKEKKLMQLELIESEKENQND